MRALNGQKAPATPERQAEILAANGWFIGGITKGPETPSEEDWEWILPILEEAKAR